MKLLCPDCGHERHAGKRCVVFVGESQSVDIPGLGEAVYYSSRPCNCPGQVATPGEDTSDDRMTVACTLLLNERRIPC